VRVAEARHQKVVQAVLVREPLGRLQRAEPRSLEVASRVVEREHVHRLLRNDGNADVQQRAGARELGDEPSVLGFGAALGLDLSNDSARGARLLSCIGSLKNVWKDVTRALPLEPRDLLVRLGAAVPPPWFNMVRYSGVLEPQPRAARSLPAGSARARQV
jgi:hypothetical protein